MSCSLYWRPISKAHRGGFKGTVRDALIERYGNDGVLDRDSLPFLQGMAAAKLEGAQELIDAIEQHDEIQIWREC